MILPSNCTRQMTDEDAKHMRHAIEEACTGAANGDGGPFGTVIVKDGQVIATGHNIVLKTKDPTSHAETVAIRNATHILDTPNLSGCIMYTSCIPCPMCMSACVLARVDAIYYAATPQQATDFGFGVQHVSDYVKDPMSDTSRVLAHFDMEDTLKPFRVWEAKEDKTKY